MPIKSAELKDGIITFHNYDVDDFLILENSVCKLCKNYWHIDPDTGIPACIPPDAKDPSVTVSAGFDGSKALCISQDNLDPKTAKRNNLHRVLFEADQDQY